MREPLRAVDANVLLRYLLDDIRDQAEVARRLVESGRALGLSPVALAEVAWTLSGRLYGWERQAVASGLLALLALENTVPLGFEKAEAQVALLACARREGAADFGDALIAAGARSFGVTEIYSFDRRFERAGLLPVAPTAPRSPR